MKLDEFLTRQSVPFSAHVAPARLHRQAAVAQMLHVRGRRPPKLSSYGPAMATSWPVLPATHRVDLERLRQDLGEDEVGLADEGEIGSALPDCERAMPPFRQPLHLPTVVDDSLAADDGDRLRGPESRRSYSA